MGNKALNLRDLPEDFLRRAKAQAALSGMTLKDFVIQAVEKISEKKVPVAKGPRRAGDPAALVASSEKIQRELGWRPRYTQLEAIVETAWRWHSSHPRGYND